MKGGKEGRVGVGRQRWGGGGDACLVSWVRRLVAVQLCSCTVTYSCSAKRVQLQAEHHPGIAQPRVQKLFWLGLQCSDKPATLLEQRFTMPARFSA